MRLAVNDNSRSGLVMAVAMASAGIGAFLTFVALVSVSIGVFNLLPIPPLDGGHLVEAVIPRRLLPAWEHLMPYGMVLLLVLVFWPFGSPLGKVYLAAAQLMWSVI